ncbi:hypothetical protein B296_00004631 [Ensete ventricosum]|uniref:Uncharacterized protein n=1 Tax=Ensete ventricosum TaxID=4639 RepID=A0A427AKA3_ENSVE|nr:hypothetical protein B296_00004631 [Ensete ventricosum]
MAVKGAVGLGMAGRGAILVLHTSLFNCSSWIRAKEIAAIRVYGCRDFTSPRISNFRPSIKPWKRARFQLTRGRVRRDSDDLRCRLGLRSLLG